MLRAQGANRLLRFFEKMDIPDRGVVSEDLSFCIRWNRMGGKTWAAIGYPISHVGPYDYKGRYLDSVEAHEREEAARAQAAIDLAKAQPLQIEPMPADAPALIAAE